MLACQMARSSAVDTHLAELLLNFMLNQNPNLDLMFQALADPTRRAMIDRLSRGPASVSELAKPFDMSLPAVVQHLQALEASGLVSSQKVGRVRTCQIEPEALSRAEHWLNERRTLWVQRLDRLGDYLAATEDEAESK
jgi:DNA-binding transcriptional ArsR family regulator